MQEAKEIKQKEEFVVVKEAFEEEKRRKAETIQSIDNRLKKRDQVKIDSALEELKRMNLAARGLIKNFGDIKSKHIEVRV